MTLLGQASLHTVIPVSCVLALSRNHVWGIISAVSLLRRLQYWLKQLLRLLRLRQTQERVSGWWSIEHHCILTAGIERGSYASALK